MSGERSVVTVNEPSSRRGFLRATVGAGVAAGLWSGPGGAARRNSATFQGSTSPGASWPMYQHDAANSGTATTTGPKDPVESAWTVETDGSLVTQPIVANGTVFQTSRDSRIYAVTAATGEEEWSVSTSAALTHSPVVSDGIVAFPEHEETMFALSTGVGGGVWKTGIQSGVSELTFVGDGVSADNGIVFGQRNNNGVSVTEIELTSGESTWSHTEQFNHTDVNDVRIGSPTVAGDTLLFAYNVSGSARFSMYDDTFLVAVSMDTGERQWKQKFGGGGARIGVRPNADRDAVYVAQRGTVIEKDLSNGSNNWTFSNIDKIHVAPFSDSGQVYVLTNEPALHVIDPTIGTRRSKHDLAGNPASPPVIADGVLYYGSTDNSVYAYELTSGEQLWQYETGNTVSAAPTVLDGTLYVASTDNTLYALRESGDLSPGDVTGDGAPAQDLDEDGLYEDINGDGGFTIVDVQALFSNLDSDVVQNNVSKFDFNGDGEVDINDVQRLYAMLQE